MKKNEKKTVLAKALTSVADGMLSKAANSRCALSQVQICVYIHLPAMLVRLCCLYLQEI